MEFLGRRFPGERNVGDKLSFHGAFVPWFHSCLKMVKLFHGDPKLDIFDHFILTSVAGGGHRHLRTIFRGLAQVWTSFSLHMKHTWRRKCLGGLTFFEGPGMI